MGKKRSRTKKTSKGIMNSINRGVIKAISREVDFAVKQEHIIDAWRKGKNPWVTVPNIGGQSNIPYVKIRANSYYGNPKEMGAKPKVY